MHLYILVYSYWHHSWIVYNDIAISISKTIVEVSGYNIQRRCCITHKIPNKHKMKKSTLFMCSWCIECIHMCIPPGLLYYTNSYWKLKPIKVTLNIFNSKTSIWSESWSTIWAIVLVLLFLYLWQENLILNVKIRNNWILLKMKRNIF